MRQILEQVTVASHQVVAVGDEAPREAALAIERYIGPIEALRTTSNRGYRL